jgi:chemotaxis protein MotB
MTGKGMFGLLCVACVAFSGCANGDKDRTAAMDAENKNLAGQLSRARGDLDAANRDREALNRRLAGATQDVESLRAQLANRPEPPAEVAPGWTAVPGGAMIAINDDVLFASGKAVLREEAKRTLDGVVSAIQGEYGTKDIMVFGHTDDRPIKKSGWEDNWQLSTERSLAVVRYLKERGVATDRLVAAGCGEHRPRTKNDSEPSRFSNRRVEIFAIEPQSRTGRH